MSRRSRLRAKKAAQGGATLRGQLTVNRKNRSGHYQGRMYSEVYRDSKVFVYTA